jgi:hypothetical protein
MDAGALLRRMSGVMPYDALDAVAVETEYGPPYLHRLALVTSAGRVPLTSAYDDAHERVAALGRAIQAASGRITICRLERERYVGEWW